MNIRLNGSRFVVDKSGASDLAAAVAAARSTVLPPGGGGDAAPLSSQGGASPARSPSTGAGASPEPTAVAGHMTTPLIDAIGRKSPLEGQRKRSHKKAPIPQKYTAPDVEYA